MLITCPECKKQISDKSKQCIYCGYPLSISDNICTICGFKFDLFNIMELIKNNEPQSVCIREIRELTNLSLFDSKQLYDYISSNDKIPANFVPKESITQPQLNIDINKPKCPTCSSTDIQKIGAGERAVSVVSLGIFSKKINKTFKCKNCGYTW